MTQLTQMVLHHRTSFTAFAHLALIPSYIQDHFIPLHNILYIYMIYSHYHCKVKHLDRPKKKDLEQLMARNAMKTIHVTISFAQRECKKANKKRKNIREIR